MRQSQLAATPITNKYQGMRQRLLQTSIAKKDRNRNQEIMQNSLFIDSFLSIAQESEPHSSAARYTHHSPKFLSPLIPPKTTNVKPKTLNNICGRQDHILPLSDSEFGDSFSDSLDECMEAGDERLDKFSSNSSNDFDETCSCCKYNK